MQRVPDHLMAVVLRDAPDAKVCGVCLQPITPLYDDVWNHVWSYTVEEMTDRGIRVHSPIPEPEVVALSPGTPLPEDPELVLSSWQVEQMGERFIASVRALQAALEEAWVPIRAAVESMETVKPKKKHTPPMWAIDPSKSKRTRRMRGQSTRQGKN